MSVLYLEHDDEITTAIARIRAVSDRDAVLVMPSGSRIATSRINFKLFAREAAERRMNVVVVSDEAQVRALAISAGLPAYDSTAGAEEALAGFREQDKALTDGTPRTMPRQRTGPLVASEAANQTHVYRVTPTGSAAPSIPVDTAVMPAAQGTRAAARPQARRRVPVAPVLVVGLALLLVAAVGYGAFAFLPTATITVRPAAALIRAAAFSVVADPTVAVVDAAAGVIPAQRLDVPVHVLSGFTATGNEAHDTRASGSVTFKSENTLNAVPIPADTVLSTADGTQFATVADVTVPKASFATGPAHIDADVRAVKGGIAGNVDAATITVVPQTLAAQLVTVTNSNPITGGKHVEDRVVSQNDYDNALSSLTAQLDGALATALVNPQNVPRGLVAYAATAQMSAAQANQPPEALVGTVATGFTLGLDASAQVTAVNESLINDVAAARLRAALARGQKLVGDQVTAIHDQGTVVGDTVAYSVQASALGYTDPNPQTLVTTVLGKSLVEARAALAAVGSAEIRVWPDFVDHLPDQAGRISVTVVPPSVAPQTLAPSPSLLPRPSLTPPVPSATPRSPSAAPAATTSPSAS